MSLSISFVNTCGKRILISTFPRNRQTSNSHQRLFNFFLLRGTYLFYVDIVDIDTPVALTALVLIVEVFSPGNISFKYK